MSGAPLPLLGIFHEFSISVDDVRGAVEFYERLGFTQATTTDTYSHPYGVLTDGRLCIGLHRRGPRTPVITFVRSAIAQRVPEFAAAGIELTVARTSEEVFNEIGFEDPHGQALAVLEARTYSPVDRSEHQPSLCGRFAEISLPAADFAAAQAFWEPLGFVAAEEQDEPHLHLPLTSDHLDVSFHRPRLCERPMLVFRDSGLAERLARLRALDVPFAPRPRGLSADATLLETPDGTPLLLLPER